MALRGRLTSTLLQDFRFAFVVLGPPLAFFTLWTLIGFDSILKFQKISLLKAELPFVFLALCVSSLIGLLLNLWKVARYNRHIFPRLHWNWEHRIFASAAGDSA